MTDFWGRPPADTLPATVLVLLAFGVFGAAIAYALRQKQSIARRLDKFEARVRFKVAAIFCAAFRHSNVETHCFGYHYCARCSAQVGDSLAGAYSNNLVVGMECACNKCRDNWKHTTFVDRFMVATPEWINDPDYAVRKRLERDRAIASMKAEQAERARQ